MTSSQRKKYREPWLVYGLVSILLALVLAAAAYLLLEPLNPLLSWVAAASIVTFLAFGYDKAISGTKGTRVPESVLLALVFLGGTLGAVAGMVVFRHKTAKGSFQLKLLVVVAIQVALIAIYFGMIRPYFGPS